QRTARIDAALVGIDARDAGQRPLGMRRGGGIVARAVDALAGGELQLRVAHLGLPLLQLLQRRVEGLGGADSVHRDGLSVVAVSGPPPAAACRTPPAPPAASSPPPGSSAGTGSAAPPLRRG